MPGAERSAIGQNWRNFDETSFGWKALAAQMQALCEWAASGGTTPEKLDFCRVRYGGAPIQCTGRFLNEGDNEET